MTGRTLLGLWAHPDDEAFLSAGLMLEHVRRGDRVVVVTATLGQHGTDQPDRWPPARLAAIRHDELRRSLARLGVHEHHLLGFEDGSCDHEDGTAAISRLIADVRPDLTVTFGPDGLTGHPDHRAVSRWATDAWLAVGQGALWYATLTPDFEARWGDINDRVGLWFDDPAELSRPADELCRTIELSGHALRTKVAALRAHHSQTARLVHEMGARAFRAWWSVESFRDASSELATPHQVALEGAR